MFTSAVKSIFLGMKGNKLSLKLLEKNLCQLLFPNVDLNIEDRSEFLSLASEFDITLDNTSLNGPRQLFFKNRFHKL